MSDKNVSKSPVYVSKKLSTRSKFECKVLCTNEILVVKLCTLVRVKCEVQNKVDLHVTVLFCSRKTGIKTKFYIVKKNRIRLVRSNITCANMQTPSRRSWTNLQCSVGHDCW